MNNVISVSGGKKDIYNTIFIVKAFFMIFCIAGYVESYAIRQNAVIQKFGMIFCGPLIIYGLCRILPIGISKYNKNNNAKIYEGYETELLQTYETYK